MSVRKLLVLIAAGSAVMGATAAMAGGPDHMAMPAAPGFENTLYVEAHGGATLSNWGRETSNVVLGTPGVSVYSPNTRNGKGGWIGGADVGYNVTPHIAFEGGWFYVPRVTGIGTGNIANSGAGGRLAIKSWLAYTAAKLSVPVFFDNFDLVGKVGVGYRALNYSYPSGVAAALPALGTHGHYWSPVFAAGAQYDWNSWLFGVQYLYFPGNSQTNYGNTTYGAPNSAPSINQFTGSVGYKFAV